MCIHSSSKTSYRTSKNQTPVVIVSRGGAGSKRLLKLFDHSPNTHCRNEPNLIEESAFKKIPGMRPVSDELFLKHFPGALAKSSRSLGQCDRIPSPSKVFHRKLAWKLQLWRIFKHRKIQQKLGKFWPAVRSGEWTLPCWLVYPKRFDQARPVIRISGIPTWVTPMVKAFPEMYVINLVRHPGASISSWRHRVVPRINPDKILLDNRERIRNICADFPEWREMMPNQNSMSAVEAELWNWRFVVTKMHEDGKKHSRYHLIFDEDIIQAPKQSIEGLFKFVNLTWSREVSDYADSMKTHWLDHSAPWRTLVNPGDAEIVDRVLKGSLMEQWWESDHVVSRHDYRAF